MKFQVKKAENCFSDSQTYEYLLPVTAEDFSSRLEGWSVRKNRALRRPVLIAERGGVRLRATLAGRVLRVSFPNRDAGERVEFERWLEEEPEC